MDYMLSIVIAVYNDSRIINETLTKLFNFENTVDYNIEIVLVDDGSSDNTVQIIRDTTAYKNNIKLLQNEKNTGKGFSIKKGVIESSGQYILVTDSDLQISLDETEKFIEKLKSGYDIVMGSRLLEQSKLIGRQKLKRRFIRSVLSLIVKSLLFSDITDSQCGFKIFKRPAADEIFQKLSVYDFGYDIEMIYLAKKSGKKIIQLPITWSFYSISNVNIVTDSISVLITVIKLAIKKRAEVPS